MDSLDSQTLLASIEAVRDQVQRYEALIESDTVTDIEDYEELLDMYQEALKVLADHYQTALNSGENLPPLESILNPGQGRDSARVIDFGNR